MRLSISKCSKSLFTVFAILALGACGNHEPTAIDNTPSQSGPVKVVTTIYPLTYFTEQIGGNHVNVTQMIKPGIESHDFEPTPSDVRLIGAADVFVFNHEEFESWALDLVSSAGNRGIRVVTAADGEIDAGLDQDEHDGQVVDEDHEGEEHEKDENDGHGHEDGLDPHVWLNPVEASGMVNRILEALVDIDPESAARYTSNANQLIGNLEQLDSELTAKLNNCIQSTIVVSHLAYGHMAERYGFTQIGLAGLSPEFEFGPSQIASVVDRINELGIEHIMQEPIVGGLLAETVSAETGTELLQLHPLEVRTVQEVEDSLDFIDIMEQNGETLRTALNCN